MKESQILQAISDIAIEQKDARERLAYHKRAAVEAESALIAANIQRDRLNEQLRVCRLQTPRYEETPRDREIAHLKEVLPELLKKIQ